jgi:hypothetical protein
MKRDRSMDTTDVVYIRSMTNTSYVLGKACGTLLVFFCLTAFSLLCAAAFNFLSGDVPVRWVAYGYYALLICAPTLVFCVGTAFFCMSIIRSQPLSLAALSCFFGLAFFFLPDRLFSVFDFAALRAPLMYSDAIGFGRTGSIVALRGMYLLLGLAFVLAAALRLKRLPQSTIVSRATFAFALIFAGVGIAAGYLYVQGNLRGQERRAHTVELHNRLAGAPCIAITREDLSVFHSGPAISAAARVTISNATDGPINEYRFRLNPGLAIRKIIGGGRPMEFRRDFDYVFVNPLRPLPPKALDTVNFSYAGTIDESACYLDVPFDERTRSNAVFFLQKQSRCAIIEKRMVVLTPESQYYPQAGQGFTSDHPEANFVSLARFSLTVTTGLGLTVVSQGAPAAQTGGTWVFNPKTPMPGVTIVIGDYSRRSIVVDSVEYSLLTFAHHDRFSPFFKDLSADTVTSVVRGLKADFENRLKWSYPYSRFSVVEVPLQFTDYPRMWTAGHEALQPEMALLPENGFSLADADFKAMRLAALNRSGREEVLTHQEQQSALLQRFVQGTFGRDNAGRVISLRPVDRMAASAPFVQWLPPLSARNADLFIFPEYFSCVTSVRAALCPVFSPALEAFYKKKAAGDAAGMLRGFMGGAATDERVNEALQNGGFEAICKDVRNRSLAPDAARALGEYLFTVLQKNIGGTAFDDFMAETVRHGRFSTIDLDSFCAAVKQGFSFDFLPFLRSCYAQRRLPGYILDDIGAFAVRDKTADRFKVRFIIANPESAQGLVKASLRTGTLGGGRFGGGFQGGNRGGLSGGGATIDRIIALFPGQTKEVDIMTDQPPRMLTINTLISKNVPVVFAHQFDKPEPGDDQAPFDGEITVPGGLSREQGTVIVDDDDSGFTVENNPSPGLLRWFKGATRRELERYGPVRPFDPPSDWTEAAGPQYYGKYVHSIHYIKAGNGAKRIAWRAAIAESGTYEIYAFYAAMGFQRGGRGRSREAPQGSFHYIVHHDDGTENVALDFKDIQNGWNSLGRYHLSPGAALVELTDQGSGGAVLGDAVKWVKQ